MSWFTKEEVRFECTQCGECCRRYEYIALTPDDIERMGRLLEGKTVVTHPLPGWKRLMSLPDKSCPFLEGNLCSIYESRPGACRGFPFLIKLMTSKEKWVEAGKWCEGIGRGEVWPVKRIWNALNLAYNGKGQ